MGNGYSLPVVICVRRAGPVSAFFIGVNLIIRTFDQVSLQYWLYNSETLAFDIETTGLNTRKDKVIGFGLSDGINSAYFVHLEWDGSQLVERLSKADCEFVLRQLHNKKLICYNSSFDIRFTKNYFKVTLLDSLYSDGMLAFHTVQEEGVPFSHRPFALKTVAAHFLGEDATLEQAEMKASIKANGGGPTEYYKADTEIMARYCIQDCKLTYNLAQMFHKRIEDEGLSKFYFEDEVIPLYKHVTIPMEMGGIPVDVEALQSSLQEISADLAELESKIQAAIRPYLGDFETWFLNKDYPPSRTGSFAQAAIEVLDPNCELPRTAIGSFSLAEKGVSALPEGKVKSWLQGKERLSETTIAHIQRVMHGDKPMFNLLSKHHLKKLFFEKLQETALSYTDTGLPQCDEEFLESVRTKYTWVPSLIIYNKLTKIKGTYIERLLEEQEDGIWYPSYFQHRTVSGRYGSSAQQFPRLMKGNDLITKYTNQVRSFLIAGTGHSFVGADYESLEPKIFSHICGDEKLKNVFLQGHDFYATVAIFTEGLSQYSADKSASNYLGLMAPERRQKAKAYALGVPYGLTGYKMQFELGISQEEGERLVSNYLQGFPGLADWMKDSERRATEQGFIQSEAGRVRHMPRAKKLYEEHGDSLLDSLALWKKFHSNPMVYEKMKKTRRELKNYLNNAKNFQCQSLAASIVNRACIKINQKFIQQNLKARICLQLHDECVVNCPQTETSQVEKIMRDVMENNYKISIPLKAIPKVANTYGDTK